MTPQPGADSFSSPIFTLKPVILLAQRIFVGVASFLCGLLGSWTLKSASSHRSIWSIE